MWVHGADFQCHQLISHYLRTHMMAELVCVATLRQLPHVHPLHQVQLTSVPHWFTYNSKRWKHDWKMSSSVMRTVSFHHDSSLVLFILCHSAKNPLPQALHFRKVLLSSAASPFVCQMSLDFIPVPWSSFTPVLLSTLPVLSCLTTHGFPFSLPVFLRKPAWFPCQFSDCKSSSWPSWALVSCQVLCHDNCPDPFVCLHSDLHFIRPLLFSGHFHGLFRCSLFSQSPDSVQHTCSSFPFYFLRIYVFHGLFADCLRCFFQPLLSVWSSLLINLVCL